MTSDYPDVCAPAPAQTSLPFEDGMQDAFMRFHIHNPQVYQFLVQRARRWKDAGHEHGSIKMFWELARFEFGLETTREGGFKLNNNHHSRYARLIMRMEPDLRNFFETRELHTV